MGFQRILRHSVYTVGLEPQTFAKLIKSIICCSERKLFVQNAFFRLGLNCVCLSVQLPEDASIHDFVIELVEETKKFEESKKVGEK